VSDLRERRYREFAHWFESVCAEGERMIGLLNDRITDRSGDDDAWLAGQASEGGLVEPRLDFAGDGLQALGGIDLIESGQVNGDLDVAPEDRERSSSHADTVQPAVSNVKVASHVR
jgi:hypothetical protein